jgi:hypothetical protein
MQHGGGHSKAQSGGYYNQPGYPDYSNLGMPRQPYPMGGVPESDEYDDEQEQYQYEDEDEGEYDE